MEKYLDKVDWNYLSRNPALTIEFKEKHLDKLSWDELSRNPSIIDSTPMKPAKVKF